MVQLPRWNKAVVRRRGVALLHRFVPVTVWHKHVTPHTLRNDLIGGFIVGVMIVPTALSWASLANISLSCGLTAALVASLSYGTFGQCAALSVGPVAELTTLLISIAAIPAEARELAFQSLGVQVGLLAIALSFVDGGKVIKTIFAKAVGDGYTCAAAILAICTQAKVMFNVTAPPQSNMQDVIASTIAALRAQMTVHSLYCFALFVVYCGYLIAVKRTSLPLWVPHQLVVVVASTLLTWAARLDRVLDLAIVGDVPSALHLPFFPPLRNIIELGPYTLTLTMISFVQIYVVAQRVMPDIDPNAELFADGVTNLLVNVFGGMPVTNSFSCSAVLMEQHVHTPLTAYAAGVVVLVTIVGLTRLGVFYFLPKHTLAAIVVASVWRLVDFSEPLRLWRYSRMDTAVWVVTFVLTIFGGITVGVLAGVALSLVLVVLRIARPRAVSVGFSVTTFRYGDLRKDPELLVYPNILMWRFDAPLYFVNMGYFQERLTAALQSEVRPIDVVLVTCGKVVDMDAAALTNMPRILDSIATLDTTATSSSSSSSNNTMATAAATSTATPPPQRPRRIIILTDIHGRLETVLYATAALPIYVPEEHDRLSIAQLEASGKFPIVFRALDDAIVFAQRCISERYGNVDTAPYPNVSFVTDVVVEMAKTQALALQAAAHEREQQQQQQQHAQAQRQQAYHNDSDTDRDDGAGGGGDGERRRTRRDDGTFVAIAGSADNDDDNDDAAAHDHARVRAGGSTTAAETDAADERADDEDASGGSGGVAAEKHILLSCLRKLKRLSRFQPDRELIGVIGVVRHTELTPKQKRKFVFRDAELLRLAFQSPASGGGNNHATQQPWSRRPHGRRSVSELREFFAAAEAALRAGRLRDNAENWQRVLLIVRSKPAGLKIQLKPLYHSAAASFSDTMVLDAPLITRTTTAAAGAAAAARAGKPSPSSLPFAHNDTSSLLDVDVIDGGVRAALLVVKWGGVLTHAGIAQASVLGEKLFARFFAAGDLPLHRLLPFTQRPRVVAADEERVVNTALVVMNALTQTDRTLTKADIVLDDRLVKTLSGTTKRLLHDEYRYYEALLHIDEHAAARHFFHIPGFRQLLYIPPLDRPLRATTTTSAGAAARNGRRRRRRHRGVRNGVTRHEVDDDNDDEYSDSGNNNSNNDDNDDEHTMQGPSLALLSRSALSYSSHSHHVGHTSTATTPAAMVVSAALAPTTGASRYSLADHDYYTPLQVLRELEANMRVVVETRIARHVLNVPLGNHETLKELRGRYEAMLNNYLGAKRRARRSGGGGGGGGDDDDDGNKTSATNGDNSNSNNDNNYNDSDDADVDTAARPHASSPRRRASATTTPRDDDDNDSHNSDDDNDNDGAVTSEASEHESCLIADAAHVPPTPAMTPTTAPATVTNTSVAAAAAAVDLWSPSSSRSAGAARPLPVDQASSTHVGRARRRHATPPHHHHTTPTTTTTTTAACCAYDLSDVSKLRDYTVYDMTYNVPLLRALFAMTQMHELRHVIEAMERISTITQCMARVGENVLEGINSSKRFIIGSLVSGALLRRVNDDFRELAAADVARGVQQLLRRAQRMYMAAHGGVEQDVRHVVKLLQRLGMRSERASAWRSGSFADGDAAETDAERRLRRRFPFIALPASCYDIDNNNMDNSSNNNSNSNNDGSSNTRATASRCACTRFYFTSYLHVEGVLHCLFESDVVGGFSRPTKEDLEASMQLYMKHLIFKVFRRRNVSFTDAEAEATMRQLPLLFDSDVDYARQQRRLHEALTSLYHAMYFHSMEVYLSLGDAEATRNSNNSNNNNDNTNNDDDNGSEAMRPIYTLQERPASTTAASASTTRHNGNHTLHHGSTPCEDVRVTHDDDDNNNSAVNNTTTATATATRSRHVDAVSDTCAFSAAASPVVQLSPPLQPQPPPPHAQLPAQQQQERLQPALFDTSIHLFDGSNASERAGVNGAPLPRVASPATDARRGGGRSHNVSRNSSSSGGGGGVGNVLGATPAAATASRVLPPSSLPSSSPPSSCDHATSARVRVAMSPSPHSLTMPAAATTTTRPPPAHGVATADGRAPSPIAASYRSPYDSSSSPHPSQQQQQQQQQQRSASVSEQQQQQPRRPVIVLTTPQAGRRTALAQQVKSRVSSVTPMRRIHEGLSLDDFLHLIAEVNSAVRSQAASSSHRGSERNASRRR